MPTLASQADAPAEHAATPAEIPVGAPRRGPTPVPIRAINIAVGVARRFSPPLRRTMKTLKRSGDNWDLQGLVDWVESGGPERMPHELEPARQRARDLRRRLRGMRRETSVRNSIQMADASLVCERVSSPSRGMTVLHHAAAIRRPRWSVELGSAFGIGTLSIALGVRDVPGAIVDGIEFEGWRADIAREGVRAVLGQRADVHHGAIEDLLPRLARRRAEEGVAGVELAFVDAAHTYEATMGYHHLIARCAAQGALVIYDDIGWSAGMRRFWQDVVRAPEITDAIELGNRWGVTRYRGA